jgi:hypothetical protein
MARSKSKSSADVTPALKKQDVVSDNAAELILADFRISKVIAQRFRAPEDARTGTYKLSAKTGNVVFSEADENTKPMGVLFLTLSVDGSTTSSEDSAAKVKSFSIIIESEGRFEMHGDIDVNNESQCASLLEPIIDLMHCLCVHTARAEADSMGYRSVRPAYQTKNRPKPKLSDVVDDSE